MDVINQLYRPSLGLLTDLYQLTMAFGYWKVGKAEDEAVFHLFFRSHPFNGGFTIACGLAYVIDFLKNFTFSPDDIRYLGQLEGNDGRPLFDPAFLEYLAELEFALDVDAIPEGTVVFPHQPLLRIRGPLLQAQLIETPLLNMINFQSLIATKAARICRAARGNPVLEFGLRRAQGIDGGLAASRAAYIGGCVATSNVLAGKLLGIPVRGTHAHSWVMAFDSEYEALMAYADAMPNNCVFLVDTYDTLNGIDRAIEVGKALRKRGVEMAGIRLDSGDLAYLSIEARKRLDAAGFPDVAVVASNDLDENRITDLVQKGAAITVWGVGTRLVTGHDQPSLGGVYKLAAIRGKDRNWKYKIKKSEQAVKTTIPGILQVRRFFADGQAVADMIYDIDMGVPDKAAIINPLHPSRSHPVPVGSVHDDLLVPVFQKGILKAESPSLAEIRERAGRQMGCFDSSVLRLVDPQEYPSGVEENLHQRQAAEIRQLRERHTGS